MPEGPAGLPWYMHNPTGGPVWLERHGHLPDEPCTKLCPANPAKLGGNGGLAVAAGGETFYLIACLECGDPERPLPMPFDSQAERGKWASAHTQGTGHDRWRVWTEVRQQREESGR